MVTRNRILTRKIVLTAMIAAILTGAKLALSYVANVEVITLLIAVFTAVLGAGIVMPAVLIFIVTETFLYGFGTWVLSYIIYWPLLVCVFSLCAKSKNDLIFKLCAVVFTAFFGVLTSLVDTGLVSANFDDFFARFLILYARGSIFYTVHVLCNLATFAFLFSPLKKILDREYSRYIR